MAESGKRTKENWLHEPPCERGGYTEVSPTVMAEGETCPVCGVALVPPPSVREQRAKKADEGTRLTEAWRPPTPREVLRMAQENGPDAPTAEKEEEGDG